MKLPDARVHCKLVSDCTFITKLVYYIAGTAMAKVLVVGVTTTNLRAHVLGSFFHGYSCTHHVLFTLRYSYLAHIYSYINIFMSYLLSTTHSAYTCNSFLRHRAVLSASN